MVRSAVQSSSLLSVGYDPEHEILELQFQQGHVYRYAGVPARVYADLMRAESIGGYVNQRIKPCYPTIDVDRAEAA
jgi:hypothetical protein